MSIARGGGPSFVCANAFARKERPTLPAPRKRSIEFAVDGPIARADIPPLCSALGRLLETSTVDVVVFDLSAVVHADAATVDALARLHLTARRLGFGVRLRKASPELRELIAFMGLRARLCSESPRRLTT
jgi:ABC-type transporter Mla MlaB component